MYEEYFRLTDAPFRLNPDPRFFYGSRSHNKAMAYLHYGLKQAEGFIVITGPVGAGKSMVIGHLLDQLNASNVVAANLLTSNIEPQDLVSQILSAFRIEPEGEGRAGEIEAFEDYLFDQLNRGRRVLLIIDEAQNLPFKTLEELRMLSNIDYEGTPLFQVFLVGQPEFRAIMEAPNMEQLRQRVIASYHLEPLTEEETRDYILHRLAVAGWREDPAFTKGAFKAIHEQTHGLPRRINTLCNRLMLYCSLEEAHEVTAKVVETVSAELRDEKLEARKPADAMPAVPQVHNDDEPAAKAPAKEEKAPAAEEAPAHTKLADVKDAVVLSLDEAREKTGAEEQTAPEDAADEKPRSGVALSSSLSVLDRLRSKKPEDERQEATLTDVASAIAAASAANETAEASSDAVEVPRTPPKRKGLRGALDEARDELKQANGNVARLLGAAEKARARRAEIAQSLSRAESLLNELRRAQA
ncbi:XrtA/PEP-CTERM system-associated ATPase [Hyphococcus luteus]|nr:XrtA/PEP-CTERM system-associated ATPase [Marinicaulis flavus]